MRTQVAECVYKYPTRLGDRYIVLMRVRGKVVTKAAPPGCTLREAVAFRDQLRVEYAKPQVKKEPAKPTLSEALALWLTDGKIEGKAPKTLRGRQQAVEALLRAVGDKPLHEIGVADYERARNGLLEGTIWDCQSSDSRPSKAMSSSRASEDSASLTRSSLTTRRQRPTSSRAKSSRPLAPGTVGQYLDHWKALASWAKDRGWVATVEVRKVARPKVTEPVAQALSLDALQAFLAVCHSKMEDDTNAFHSAPYAHLLAAAAIIPLRISEWRGMQWRDLDMSSGFFHLSRALSDTGGVVKTEDDTKLHKRSVPIIHIIHYLKAQKAWLVSHGQPDIDPEGWVWSDVRGNPLPASTIRAVLFRWQHEAGLERFRFHDLRHTGASRMLEAGMSVANVQVMTGHKNPNILLSVYVHADPLHTLQEAARYGAMVQTPAARKMDVG